jgi:hypothetical protein
VLPCGCESLRRPLGTARLEGDGALRATAEVVVLAALGSTEPDGKSSERAVGDTLGQSMAGRLPRATTTGQPCWPGENAGAGRASHAPPPARAPRRTRCSARLDGFPGPRRRVSRAGRGKTPAWVALLTRRRRPGPRGARGALSRLAAKTSSKAPRESRFSRAAGPALQCARCSLPPGGQDLVQSASRID